MSTLRFGLCAAGLILAMLFVAVLTIPDFVTPALVGMGALL